MQKIDNSIFKILKIVLASFQVKNKLGKARFFKKPFLLADFSMKMILEMLFLTFSNANILFAQKNTFLKGLHCC